MDVFVVGAAGGVGRRLARRLTERGDRVRGLHRNPEQADTVRASGAEPVQGDLVADTVPELAERLRGCDAVVFLRARHAGEEDRRRAPVADRPRLGRRATG